MKQNYLDFTRSKTNHYMRDVFIDSIYEYAKKNKDLFFTTPDMGAPSLDKFREDLPKQFIHSGICEQHMISMAAGLTLMGKKIVCYAMAPFITSRCYEQIKCSVAAMEQPVNLVGIGVGLGYADAGPTHYTTEDIATMRVFPNIEIITPADEVSTKILAEDVVANDKFRFLRLDRDVLPIIYDKAEKFDLKKGFYEVVKGKKKKCIVTCGYLLHKSREIIEQKYNDFTLVDLFKIKPLSKEFLDYIQQFEDIITIEEQWTEGGFGSCIIESLSDLGKTKKITRYGLKKRFIFENGGRDHLLNTNGLNLLEIFESENN